RRPSTETSRPAKTYIVCDPRHARLCCRHDIAAYLAGSKILVVEKTSVGFGNRILCVIAHHKALFVQESVAVAAVPVKAIDFAFPSLALRDKREGIGRKARRVRDTGRGVDDGAFGNDRDFLFTLRSSIVKIHLTLYHVHRLVAGVDVKLAPVFATAGDEDE